MQSVLQRLRERWFAWRDHWLMDPAFQRWAVDFPLTRFLARRRSRALFDLCAGFIYSQVLLAVVRLKLLERVRAGPVTVAEVQAELDLPPDGAARLLKAAASLGLLERRAHRPGDGDSAGARYGLGELGAALLGNPGVLALIEHHGVLYPDLEDPVALLRGRAPRTRMADYWPYAGAVDPALLAPAAVTGYTAVMSASQALIAAEVLATYPLDRHARLLDVGGGDGQFLRAVAARYPHLALVLFDLPAVTSLAAARFAGAGLGGRAELAAGSFFTDPLPAGADLITLVRVLHDHDDAAALAILRAVRAALPAGGTLLIAEPMAGSRGAEAMADAYFGFYLLAMGSGRARTPDELAALTRQAGFGSFRALPGRAPLLTRVAVVRGG
jgi:demethylspheroidene O-methyltransferase